MWPSISSSIVHPHLSSLISLCMCVYQEQMTRRMCLQKILLKTHKKEKERKKRKSRKKSSYPSFVLWSAFSLPKGCEVPARSAGSTLLCLLHYGVNLRATVRVYELPVNAAVHTRRSSRRQPSLGLPEALLDTCCIHAATIVMRPPVCALLGMSLRHVSYQMRENNLPILLTSDELRYS